MKLLLAKNHKLIKACWIRGPIDNYLDIDILWFNFINESKRFIKFDFASKLIPNLPQSLLKIWVFSANDKIEDISNIVHSLNLDWAQLHNFSDIKYVENLKSKILNKIIFLSISYSEIDKIDLFKNYSDLFIIDSCLPWSWQWYDYQVLKWKINTPFLIAWWINVHNAKIAVNCDKYCIWVDVASWIEKNWNIDLLKIREIRQEIFL